MIFIGCDDKNAEIKKYTEKNDIQKIIVISHDSFPLFYKGADHVKYSDVIMYVTFYRLLQEIDTTTLVVINECLRTQNRYDLSYNCIRNFLNLTRHQLIFQLFPQIDTKEDFMILFDFDTQSKWKRRPFDPFLISNEASVNISELNISFTRIDVPTSEKTKSNYCDIRDKMFREIGNKDPHTIPRNLYLIGGKEKLPYVFGRCVARNKRFGIGNIDTYTEAKFRQDYTIFEFPHRFIDFLDFLYTTRQFKYNVLVSDLKVDNWYFSKYTKWSERINDTYASLS